MKRLLVALLALAACGRGGGYQVIAETTPAPTTTYVSRDTINARMWWGSLSDVQRYAICDTYGAAGGEQQFVDLLVAQGAFEPWAWVVTAVIAENCQAWK